MTNETLEIDIAAQLRRYRAELAALEPQIADLTIALEEKKIRCEGLRQTIEGLEKLEKTKSQQFLPFEDMGTEEKTVEDVLAERESTSIREAVYKIVEDLGHTRSVPFKKIVAEAKTRKIENDAKNYANGIQYALNALRKNKRIRTPHKGWYKVIPSKVLMPTHQDDPIFPSSEELRQ